MLSVELPGLWCAPVVELREPFVTLEMTAVARTDKGGSVIEGSISPGAVINLTVGLERKCSISPEDRVVNGEDGIVGVGVGRLNDSAMTVAPGAD